MSKKSYLALCIFAVCNFTLASQPLVSIIVSVYKGDTFIEGFMADISRQTIFDRTELIMIDAASPGNEAAIIKRYMEHYDNIIYIRLAKDPGIYGVWNYGIHIARADLLTYAGIDDRLAPDCYEKHFNALATHPEIDLVYSDLYVTYHPNETIETTAYHHIRHLPEFSLKAMKEPLPNNHPMWRKTIHDKYGLFDEQYKYAGDYEMWLRAAAGGAQFLKVPGILGLYYYNPQGLSTNKAWQQKIALEEKDIHDHYCYLFE